MTHPLMTAFHKVRPIADAFLGSKSDIERAGLSSQMDPLWDHIEDVMASSPIPEFLVGFLMGANNKVYLVWIWPLSVSYSQYYWVEDGTYSRPFTA